MTRFNEFRVNLDPDIQATGNWNVTLVDCPLNVFVGPQGTVQGIVTHQQLLRLRSQHNWPNLPELKAIGESVWESLMNPELKAAFFACLNVSENAGRGMRLVVSVVGEEPEPTAPERIRLQELPLEALYFDQQNFLAPNPATPISRGLQFKPDREAHRVALPLRILIVVATPNDKPPANMQDEKNIIQKALEKLTGPGGAVELEFCEPTRPQLTARLQSKRFHIVHFIGHGAFDIVGDDPSPRPHLCLENADHQSDPLDAETLQMLLLNSDVRLVVMTACSSANPTPEEEPYHARAYDGVAQRLIGGGSGVSAVVAMQFDLESDAAVTFSRIFYTNLLRPDRTLDEVVTLCRQALVGQMDAGHRAWVTPVVYWRCKDGQVFELEAVKVEHDEQTQTKLNEIDAILGVYMKNIAEVRSMPQEMQNAAMPLVAGWQREVEGLYEQRGRLLGDTLRLRGGPVEAGGATQCRLTLQLRTPARIGDVSVLVRYPTDKVHFGGASAGANTPLGNDPMLGGDSAAGALTLLLQDVSQGGQWEPDEFELAKLDFQVQAGVSDPIVELSLVDARVQRDGADTAFDALNAVLFVT
jgi:hypothetical protein